MHTRTRQATAHPEAVTVVEVWTSEHDEQPPYLVGVYARTDDPEVVAGAALLCDACCALGFAGTSLVPSLLRQLDGDDREVLARAVLEACTVAALTGLPSRPAPPYDVRVQAAYGAAETYAAALAAAAVGGWVVAADASAAFLAAAEGYADALAAARAAARAAGRPAAPDSDDEPF
jgi:hypothetical protein